MTPKINMINKKGIAYLKLLIKLFGVGMIPVAAYSYLANKNVRVKHNGAEFDIKLNYLGLRAISRIERKVGEVYLLSSDNKKIYAKLEDIIALETEYFSDFYDKQYECECKGKRILDIGGYIGDSALFFMERSAKYVDIYEPIDKNVELIKLNLKGRENKYTVNQKFIADHNGKLEVSSKYTAGSMGFGLEEGDEKYVGTCIDIRSIPLDKYDVVKMDCEGCEYNLLVVPDDQIKQVPYWIIEFHNIDKRPEYGQSLKKFEQCGFEITKNMNIDDITKIIHFKIKH